MKSCVVGLVILCAFDFSVLSERAFGQADEVVIPRDATELHAKVIATLSPRAQQWIHDQAKYVAQTPGAENSAEFLDALQRFPKGDIMALEFAVFKESIERTNSDKRDLLARLQEMNKISEQLGDYLEYLNEKTHELQEKIDSDTLCQEGGDEVKKGINKLQTLQKAIPSGTAFVVRQPKTIGELKAAIKAAAIDLKGREPRLKKSIRMTSARLGIATARCNELFLKMMKAMKKARPIR